MENRTYQMRKDLNKNLKERQKLEENFHDARYKVSKARQNVDRKKNISRSYTCFHDLRGDVRDLKVLDYGCGDGWTSIELAKEGATVWGIDISNESISKSSKSFLIISLRFAILLTPVFF